MIVTVVITLLMAALSGCGTAGEPKLGLPDVEPGEPEVEQVELEWSAVDVGTVAIAGATEVINEGDELRVTASGEDIWGTSDSFHFVHVAFEGDLDIRARIDDLAYTHEWAKAGVMVRQALEAGSPHTLMSLTPSGDAEFIHRLVPNGSSSGWAQREISMPTWVRLIRSGTTLTGLISGDGEDWSEVGSVELELSGEIYVGVAVTSRSADAATQALVRGVAIYRRGETPPPAVDPIPTPTDPPPSDGYTPGPVPGQWVCPTEPLTPAFAPTLFVATNGSDANDGRSIDRPFRTLQRAAGEVGPGDVVWVRGGVYGSNVEFRRSGTRDAPIVVESYPGECAVFDGAGLGRFDRVTLEGVEHMILRNIVVRNSSSEGMLLSRSNHNVISNVRSYDNFTSGVLVLNSSYNLLTYVVTHDNYDAPAGGNADGISISTGDGNRIDRCVAFRNSDDGVDTWLSTNTLVERCISFDNGWQGGDGNGFKAGGRGETVNTVVRLSIAFGNRVNGFDSNTGVGVRFDHNTAFTNGGTGVVLSNGTARNNLSFNNGHAFGGSSSTQVTNSWNLGLTTPGFVSADPRHPNFLQLTGTSPAVGAGTPIGLAYDGAAPDLGAVAYGQAIASAIGVVLADLPGY